ncbi:MAG: response regulator [Gammaproteobacteria bacterium]|nr:response regulator [Gammaproteobacteria bacterium]
MTQDNSSPFAYSPSDELILVVDDDPTQSLIIQSMLENRGFDVLVADNGADAIAAFQQHNPSIILLDAIMPGLDGFETCRQINALEHDSQTAILMFTALNDDKSVDMAFKAGAVDFITKPVCWSVLIARIGYLLKQKANVKHIRRIEERLRHSQKMEAVSNIANNITHNFNNILGSIAGYTDLLIDLKPEDKSDKSAHYLQQIKKSTQRANTLVSQMRVFTNIAITHLETLKPSALLDDTLSILQPTLPGSIKLIKQIEQHLPAIKADPLQFQQMLSNLLLNASQAMSGTGNITITLRQFQQDSFICSYCFHQISGDYIELSITDTGTGIKANTLKKIFDPYYSSKPFGEAVGMGLPIVQGIVHESGGHIMVESVPDQGAEFKIVFPVTEEPSEP